MDFMYQAQKFSQARSCLMLPHSRGEAASIAEALRECNLGMHDLDRNELDDNARSAIFKLEEFMDSDRVAQFSNDEMLGFSHVIDELADWFARRKHSSGRRE